MPLLSFSATVIHVGRDVVVVLAMGLALGVGLVIINLCILIPRLLDGGHGRDTDAPAAETLHAEDPVVPTGAEAPGLPHLPAHPNPPLLVARQSGIV